MLQFQRPARCDPDEYVKPLHVPLFKAAAREFQHYILVRRTNPKAFPYMGAPGYTGKYFDCKWKTADKDVGGYRTGGLVVSPEIHPRAFSSEKLEKALPLWQEDRELLFVPKSGSDLRTIDLRGCGKRFALQMKERDPHYGCVAFIEGGLVHPRYIHADYDLYDLIEASNPAHRPAPQFGVMPGKLDISHAHQVFPAVRAKAYAKQVNAYGPMWFRIQAWIDARLGYPMIFHGEQTNYKPHEEDRVVAFFPDGRTVACLDDLASIVAFFEGELKGRETARPGK